MTDDELRELDRLLVQLAEHSATRRERPTRQLQAIGVLRSSISVIRGRRKRARAATTPQD